MNIVRTVARNSSNRFKFCWLKVIYCICPSNELEREIKHKTGGAKQGASQKSGGSSPTQASLRTATARNAVDYASLKPNKFCNIKTARIFNKNITRNALRQAKAGQSHQHTDNRRMQPEYEKYRVRNTLRSTGESFRQRCILSAQRITAAEILTLTHMIRVTKSQSSQNFSAVSKVYETSTNQISRSYHEGIPSY